MKTTLIGVIFATALVPVVAQGPQVPASVRVPDAATALRIAEPALVKVYGKEQIDYERPLIAELKNGVWNVSGMLCCPDGKGRRVCNTAKKPVCVGGVASAAIRQQDGKILGITHGK
jgi:hypothetical protein